MKWILTEGSPLILIGRKSLSNWKGIDNDDYDRACSVEDYAGIITVDNSQALVLGDEPCQTAVYESKALGLLFIRWQWAEDEASVQNLVEQLTSDNFENPEEEIEFIVDDNSLILFDSVLSGIEAEGLLIRLPASSYLVSTVCYAPNEETSLILHRFKLKGGS